MDLTRALLYAGIGAVAIVVGAGYAAWRTPKPVTRSVLQHAAAGGVLGGLTVDVFPVLLSAEGILWGSLGLALGVAVMLSIRLAGEKLGGSVIAAVIILDVIVDGGLIGLSVGLGSTTALLLAVALAPEVGFLGVTLGTELKGGGQQGDGQQGDGQQGGGGSGKKLIGLSVLIGAGILGTSALGYWAGGGPTGLQQLLFGFGAIALAYLVLEELLTEAHELTQRVGMVAMIWVGFLPVFIVGMLLK